MPNRPLVELRVRHPYFASGDFAAARIVPDAATAARLRGLRLIAKQAGGAMTLFVELDDAGRPRIAIPEGSSLSNSICCRCRQISRSPPTRRRSLPARYSSMMARANP